MRSKQDKKKNTTRIIALVMVGIMGLGGLLGAVGGIIALLS